MLGAARNLSQRLQEFFDAALLQRLKHSSRDDVYRCGYPQFEGKVVLTYANAINCNGWIGADGYDVATNTAHAYVLKPRPQPGDAAPYPSHSMAYEHSHYFPKSKSIEPYGRLTEHLILFAGIMCV
jgi:hypothetical protein